MGERIKSRFLLLNFQMLDIGYKINLRKLLLPNLKMKKMMMKYKLILVGLWILR